jgi:hypothetical protein
MPARKGPWRSADFVARGKMEQVLIQVKRAASEAAEPRDTILDLLEHERASDGRIRFNPIGPTRLVALVAPHEVIARIAAHPVVERVTYDEPADAIGRFRVRT